MIYNHQLDKFRITSVETLNNCMFGGNGFVALVAPSMKCHSYRFVKPKNSSDFPDDVIFVSVLHEDKYFYIGMIEERRFRLTRNSRFDEDTESVKGAKYLMDIANKPEMFKFTSMKMYHSGRCAVCGRKIRSEKGIEHGVGTKCLCKIRAKLGV